MDEAAFFGEMFPKVDQREPHWRFLQRKVVEASAAVPGESRVVDVGAGESIYRHAFGHCSYVSTDLVSSSDRHDFGDLDVVSDAAALPFRSESFDVALNMVVMEHVPCPGTVVAEMARVLRSGGTVYALIPLVRPEHLVPYDFQRFTRYGIARMFDLAGLTVTETSPSNGALWTAVHYAQQITQDRPIRKYGRLSLRGRALNRMWWAMLAPLGWYARRSNDKYPDDFPKYFWVEATKG